MKQVTDPVRELHRAHEILSDIETLAEAGISVGATEPESKPQFVAARSYNVPAMPNGCAVMYGSECVGVMRSHTFAKRTANALNRHQINREGV